jgi:hypothetical protein
MERDKKVLSQEQLMRKQFADLLARYFAGKTAPPPRELNVFEILSSLPRSITDTELRHLRLQAGTHIREVYPEDEDAEETPASLAELLAKRIRKAAELEVSPELREWAQQQANLDRRAFIWRFGSYFGGHFYGEDETTRAKFALFALAEIERYRSRLLLAERFVRNFPSSLIEESIQNGHAFRVFYLRPDDEYLQMVLQDELESIQSEDNRVAIKPNGSLMAVLRCEFNSSEMAFIVSSYLLVGSKRMRIDLPYYEYTPEHGLNTESLIAVFKEIDESIADKYKVATETHQDWLKQAVQAWQQDMHLTTKFPSYLSLYSWMAVLATEKKQEVIVEVYPARALLETEGGPHLQVGLKDMVRKLSTNGVWRAELNEGVLIWRNWLSFIDRAVDLPLATLLRWAEESKKYPADFQHLRRSISASQANNLARLNPIIALQDLALSVKDEYFGQLKLATLGQQWFAWYWVDTLFGSARELSEGTIPLSKVPFGRFKRCIEVYLRYTTDSELHEWLWLNALSDLAILLHQRGEARISESRYRGHILELNLDGSIVLFIPVQKLNRPQRE